MAISLVNYAIATSKTSSTTLTITVPTGGFPDGSTLIVHLAFLFTGTISTSITDSVGNSYVIDKVENFTGGRVESWRASNIQGLPQNSTIIITFSLAVTTKVADVSCWTGLETTNPLDQTASNSGTGTSVDSGLTPTTTQADELVIGPAAVNGPNSDTFTALTANWIIRPGTSGGNASTNVTVNSLYKIVSATGQYNIAGSNSTSRNWAAIVVTYKAAPTGNQFTQTINETLTISDTRFIQTNKNFFETIVLSGILFKNTSRLFSEVITIVDSIFNQTLKTFSEIVSVVDSVATQIIKTLNLSEILSLIESFITQSVFYRTFTETINIIDSLIRRTGKFFQETISVVDSILAQIVFNKIFSETISIVDNLSKQAIKTFNEVVSIGDLIIRNISRTLSDGIYLVDSVTNKIFKSITLNEIINVVDNFRKMMQKTFSEVISLADNLIKQFSFSRIFTETISVVDSLGNILNRVFSETLNIIDSTVNLLSKSLVETINIVDSIIKNIGKGFEEIISIVDSITKKIVSGVKKVIKNISLSKFIRF